MRTKRGSHIFGACTFKHYPLTKRSYGQGTNISNNEIRRLQKTNPNAYVHVLYDSSRSKGFIQVKNIVFDSSDR